MFNLSFYKNKKVLITGHTGFKGAWLSKILLNSGADIIGYSLEPPTDPNLFTLAGLSNHIESKNGDIRDYDKLNSLFKNQRPDIVIHLAAQPIVRESYRNPVYTYETNVMGTVNILDCIRNCESIRSVINVTTDKVYKNNEWEWGYRECDSLDGYDPYSNSKSCSELVTQSYIRSFLEKRELGISTARAGNVIGGGDFAEDRIIPDCIRAAMSKKTIIVRSPYSVRPYQHVLEPLMAYLLIVQEQYLDTTKAGSYNIGPDECDCITTGSLVEMFCNKWGNEQKWVNHFEGGPHEANFLKLDCSKLKNNFLWKPLWHIDYAMDKIIEWTRCYLDNENISVCMDKQIQEFVNVRAEV